MFYTNATVSAMVCAQLQWPFGATFPADIQTSDGFFVGIIIKQLKIRDIRFQCSWVRLYTADPALVVAYCRVGENDRDYNKRNQAEVGKHKNDAPTYGNYLNENVENKSANLGILHRTIRRYGC